MVTQFLPYQSAVSGFPINGGSLYPASSSAAAASAAADPFAGSSAVASAAAGGYGGLDTSSLYPTASAYPGYSTGLQNLGINIGLGNLLGGYPSCASMPQVPQSSCQENGCSGGGQNSMMFMMMLMMLMNGGLGNSDNQNNNGNNGGNNSNNGSANNDTSNLSSSPASNDTSNLSSSPATSTGTAAAPATTTAATPATAGAPTTGGTTVWGDPHFKDSQGNQVTINIPVGQNTTLISGDGASIVGQAGPFNQGQNASVFTQEQVNLGDNTHVLLNANGSAVLVNANGQQTPLQNGQTITVNGNKATYNATNGSLDYSFNGSNGAISGNLQSNSNPAGDYINATIANSSGQFGGALPNLLPSLAGVNANESTGAGAFQNGQTINNFYTNSLNG